ncbi:helix-turn-helix domain-containing protein [Shinella pollutisoli]|uniref:Helix-turn-helix domain-containing protein n=1 Tax=Shinella pollutisoli TaxID=2250594 RepID=A0ABV7DK09_9HYPH|nr:helix-turn-helix transcriptional regulator [Shinella pollutisoli]
MSNRTDDRTDRRRHFIPEWAAKRGVKQADIVRATGADKGAVHRWFAEDVIPTEKYLKPLADFLDVEEVVDLFRDPDDDWMAKMFRDKTEQQKEAAITMLRLFFEQHADPEPPARSRSGR